MDPAERPAATPLELVYDGFISYSHAADDLLAPRLQAGLQKFAKPWWKRRAVRIFRDESSLAANPHLWSSITEALEDSSWFVLLLSEDAASSEWVGKEIEHWIANKPANRILPVVTDGGFIWDGDVAGSSVPPALHGVFQEEPRWVDLRFAKGDENLDLKNPAFSSAVADIAATIRGIPKDELASEEVRQHRRTIRTAWAAGGLVTILAIAAVGFGVQSSQNAAEAERQAAIAEEQTLIADSNAAAEAEARAAADANAAEAMANAEAEAEARALARSRELAASAINVLDRDPALAALLTLEAIDSVGGDDQPTEVINALWEAVAANRLDANVDHGFGGAAMFDVSDDGTQLLVSSEVGNVVQLYDTSDLSDLRMIWEWELVAPDGGGTSEDTIHNVPRLSPDGRLVAVPVIDPDAFLATDREGARPDPRPARLVILDATDGTELHSIDVAECSAVNGSAWSPDGRRLALRNGWEPCPRDGSPSGWWVEVLNTETWERLAILDLPVDPPFLGPVPTFSSTGDLFVFGNQKTMVFDEEFNLVRTFEDAFGPGDVSPGGRLIVTNDPPEGRTTLTETEGGDRVTLLPPFEFPQIPEGLKFSSTGRYIIFGNSTRQVLIWDTATAEVAFRFPSGNAEWVHIDDQRELAYTGSLSDGSVSVWSLGPIDVGQTSVTDLEDRWFVNANSFVFSDRLGAFIATDFLSGTSYVRVFDRASGVLVDTAPYPELSRHEPDLLGGLYRLIPMSGDRFIYPDSGWWTVHDPVDGSITRLTGCDAADTEDTCLGTGEPLAVMARSVDGTQLVARSGSEWVYFDAQTAEVLAEEQLTTSARDVITFTNDWVMTNDRKSIDIVDRRDGSVLSSASGVDIGRPEVSDSGRVAVFSDPVGIIVVDLQALEARTIELSLGEVRALSIAPGDGSIVVADDRAINVIDLTTDEVTQSIPYPGASDAHWLGRNTILVGSRSGEWVSLSLDVGNLISDARSSLLRSFTAQECLTYRIDPCPTLEEMQSR